MKDSEWFKWMKVSVSGNVNLIALKMYQSLVSLFISWNVNLKDTDGVSTCNPVDVDLCYSEIKRKQKGLNVAAKGHFKQCK